MEEHQMLEISFRREFGLVPSPVVDKAGGEDAPVYGRHGECLNRKKETIQQLAGVLAGLLMQIVETLRPSQLGL